MMILAMTVGEVTALIGAILSIFTVVIAPTIKEINKKKIAKNNREKKIDYIAEEVGKQSSELEELKKSQRNTEESLSDLKERHDDFTTQNLKYMINDAYFGYHDIHEIPDDILLNACECCEIYVNKLHKNHEIKPKCVLLWNELERRATSRGGVDEQ